MLDKFVIIKALRVVLRPLLHLALEELPEKHKNTSLLLQERCDISYHQGRRDALVTALKHLDVQEELAQDELDEMTEAMAPDSGQ